MRESDFETVCDRLSSGDSIAPLCRITDSVSRLLKQPYVYIVARKADVNLPIVTSGMGLWNSRMPRTNARISERLKYTVVVPDMTRDKDFHDYPIAREPLAARFFASAPLPFRSLSYPVTLTSVGYDSDVDELFVASVLEAHAGFALDYMRALLFNNMLQRTVEEQSLNVQRLQEPTPAEAHGVTSEFLLKTLIRQRRIRERNGETYLGTATWRAAVKCEQLSALKILKSSLPPEFVEAVAREIQTSVKAVTGGQTFKYVTWVPCGHSGPGCFAEKLSNSVAKIIGAESVQAFRPLPAKGSSHPRKSASLPPMQLLREFDSPILLVDDVATSGQHIQMAAKALRTVASAVFPVAWISK